MTVSSPLYKRKLKKETIRGLAKTSVNFTGW